MTKKFNRIFTIVVDSWGFGSAPDAAAFGDEGRKKPTNSGLTGHHATGKAGRMQNKQSAGTTYKATAFGGDKQKRYHKGTGGVPRSGLRTIPRYPKGHGGKTGIGRM